MFHLVPYLHFNGEAGEGLNYYKDIFTGEILMISRYSDSPMQLDESWKNNFGID